MKQFRVVGPEVNFACDEDSAYNIFGDSEDYDKVMELEVGECHEDDDGDVWERTK